MQHDASCRLTGELPWLGVAQEAEYEKRVQVMGIPFVAFDAGGVLEMFSGKLHPDNVVLEPTLEALSLKLNKVCMPWKPYL